MVAGDTLLQQCATAHCTCKIEAMFTRKTSELIDHLIGWHFEHLL